MPPAYRLAATAVAIAETMRADLAGDVWPGGEVRVGSYAPVIISSREKGRHIVPRQWGVPPPPRAENPVPFVRNLESPFWIGTLRHTQFRCLVPMTQFRKGNDWFFTPENSIMACAGIWRDSEVPSFAILTSGPDAGMPVVLKPEQHAIWLSGDIRIARQLVETNTGPA